MRVFVYGSLMAGGGNHRYLASYAGAAARTRAEWTMVSLGGFPGIMRGGATAIVGEVYDVSGETVQALDRLEGHPGFYRRTKIALEDGSAVSAYVLPDGYRHEGEVLSGSWREATDGFRRRVQR